MSYTQPISASSGSPKLANKILPFGTYTDTITLAIAIALFTSPPVAKPVLPAVIVLVNSDLRVAADLLSTLPNPTCDLVTSCGLFLLITWLCKLEMLGVTRQDGY